MLQFRSNNLASEYRSALMSLKNFYEYENPARDLETYEILNVEFNFENNYNELFNSLYINARRSSQLKYIAAEFLWALNSSNKLDFIELYASFWKNIANEKDGTCNSAYGNLLFEHNHGITNNTSSQFLYAFNELKKDKFSRRAIIFYNSPYFQQDRIGVKDFPCTVYSNFLIRNNKLIMINHMRSQDIILGFSTDIPLFQLFHNIMLCKLQKIYPNLELGNFIHKVDSLHLYKKNLPLVNEMLTTSFNSNNTSTFLDKNIKKRSDDIDWFLNDEFKPTINTIELYEAILNKKIDTFSTLSTLDNKLLNFLLTNL
jgi:thymidylate synthase